MAGIGELGEWVWCFPHGLLPHRRSGIQQDASESGDNRHPPDRNVQLAILCDTKPARSLPWKTASQGLQTPFKPALPKEGWHRHSPAVCGLAVAPARLACRAVALGTSRSTVNAFENPSCASAPVSFTQTSSISKTGRAQLQALARWGGKGWRALCWFAQVEFGAKVIAGDFQRAQCHRWQKPGLSTTARSINH